MKTYILEKETLINAPVKEVWQFFSDPHNLQRITPAYMKFKVVSCPEVPEVYHGMLIEYRVRPLLNIPMKWVTLIKEVAPLQSFTDTQLQGPYTLWEHQHTFKETGQGTLMNDRVKYALPLAFLGQVAHSLFVRRQLQGIFTYREKVIKTVFP